MSRSPRILLADYPHHVVQRGHNRQSCFFSEADRRRYLELLEGLLVPRQCALHAYVLMTNHVHLLVTPSTDQGVSQLMKSVNERYVRWVNRRLSRTGTLWEGRFHASVIDSDRYLLACYRYIELNPVRAGLASHPGDYQWSSYAANALGAPDPIVENHPLYLDLGRDSAGRQLAYRTLLARQDTASTRAIGNGIRKSMPVGTPAFARQVAQRAGVALPRGNHGGRRNGSGRRARIKLVRPT